MNQLTEERIEMISIFIVEDDPQQSEALKLQLIDCGYRIAAMFNYGEVDIEQMHAFAPDVVLMDIVLPVKRDVIETAQKIRESCNVPVLYLTAYADEEFLLRAKVTEPYAYLLKPCTCREIRLVIESALYRHKTERMAREILEKAVTERTTKLERAQSIANMGSWDYDLLTGQLAWSEELYRIYGVSPETFTPTLENLISLIHHDDQTAMQAWIAACISGKEPGKLEFRCVWPDDTVHVIEGQGKLMSDVNGKPVSMSGTGQDITERKLAEMVLLQHKVAIDTMFDGFLITDDQGVLLKANQAYARMSGYSVDELLGMHIVQLEAQEQSLDEVKAHIAKIIAQGRDVFETRHRRKDGHEIELEVSVSYIAGSKQFVAFYRDITERKRIADELERTRNQQKLILDSAEEGIYGLDLQGRTTFVNPAASRMLGWTADELIGQPMHDLLHHTRPDGTPFPSAQCPIYATLKDGVIHHSDDELFFRRDGSSFAVEYLSAPKFIDGVISGAVVTFNDISKRKQAEEALRIAAVAFETQDPILITDAHANIVKVNRAFSEVTGYSTEELQGKNPRLMNSGRHERYFFIEMWQELLHAGSWAGEIWDKHVNGKIYPKWMSVSAVKNERQEITHYVAIFSDITARKRIEEQIHHMAFYDELTKLPNRRLFLDRLQAALNASARHNDYGAVMFIDLDHFKELNDLLGHDYGDLLLKEVGARIKSCVREMDTVARFGGDEFVVLIESFSNDQNDAIRKVALVAEKIREALMQPYKLKEHEHHSSSSIGICLYHGDEDSLDTLIEHADLAMYDVKKCGRNAVRFFDPAMQQSLATHDALVNDLHHALVKQQLQLHYQVQVGKDNHPLGAEAFLRWIHPEHGMIMPCKFIPIAEESALIIDIDRWVLNSACQQIALWSKNDKTHNLTLTVNISAKLFAQHDFVNEVADILNKYHVDPARLKLELSERIVQTDLNSSMDRIRALRRLGCKLSIDNFGTVYSSLSFLKLLSPDQIKIHQEFVHNISLDANDAQMAKLVIDYAKSLGLDIFAEGVETEDQRTFLTSQDCNTFQGYLFGKPAPLEEFEVLLEKL